jgi:isopentenyldiphosphate isomerase
LSVISPGEAAHRAASDRETVLWVDEQNRPCGVLARAELRERGLIGRASFIFLFDSAGRLCLHRRTLSKAIYPGYWDPAAGGMIGPGESELDAARRELAEELGVDSQQLEAHGSFFFDGPRNRIWGSVFSTISDAPLRLQPEEVLEARFVTLEELAGLCDSLPISADSLQALELCRPGWRQA